MYNAQVDNEFQQLQQQMESTESALRTLIRNVRRSESDDVKDIEYSLRDIVSLLQDERNTVGRLLTEIHQSHRSNFGPRGFSVGGGGFLATMERAVEYGAGFGVGEDLVRKLF
ncbi:hypothetical protein ACJU26_08950 [Acidithiobacillus sp. M4-SHS-6]|uniref:hypothetical protein n=1 Tax=Acidithiobacillus sp. M4-SHS-6 TaxID=3383024 RepID=UPI0039BE25CF